MSPSFIKSLAAALFCCSQANIAFARPVNPNIRVNAAEMRDYVYRLRDIPQLEAWKARRALGGYERFVNLFAPTKKQVTRRVEKAMSKAERAFYRTAYERWELTEGQSNDVKAVDSVYRLRYERMEASENEKLLKMAIGVGLVPPETTVSDLKKRQLFRDGESKAFLKELFDREKDLESSMIDASPADRPALEKAIKEVKGEIRVFEDVIQSYAKKLIPLVDELEGRARVEYMETKPGKWEMKRLEEKRQLGFLKDDGTFSSEKDAVNNLKFYRRGEWNQFKGFEGTSQEYADALAQMGGVDAHREFVGKDMKTLDEIQEMLLRHSWEEQAAAQSHHVTTGKISGAQLEKSRANKLSEMELIYKRDMRRETIEMENALTGSKLWKEVEPATQKEKLLNALRSGEIWKISKDNPEIKYMVTGKDGVAKEETLILSDKDWANLRALQDQLDVIAKRPLDINGKDLRAFRAKALKDSMEARPALQDNSFYDSIVQNNDFYRNDMNLIDHQIDGQILKKLSAEQVKQLMSAGANYGYDLQKDEEAMPYRKDVAWWNRGKEVDKSSDDMLDKLARTFEEV